MELYLDDAYKKECENKISYLNIVYGTEYTTAANDGLVLSDFPISYNIFKNDNTITVFSSFSLLNAHIKYANNKIYLQEYSISTTAKKFILI